MKCLVGQRQHHDRHAQVENDRPGIDFATGQRRHLLNRGEIAEELSRRRADVLEDERNQTGEKVEGDDAERNDRGHDLVLGQGRRQAANREVKHAEEEKHQVGAAVRAGGMGRWLVGDGLKDPEVKERRQPQDDVEDERAEKFR